LTSIFLGGFDSQENIPVLKGPYLGQKPPGLTPEVFAPGIVSTDSHEMNTAFTPDGKEFYFCRRINDRNTIVVMKQINGQWTAPEIAPFSGNYHDRDFTISPDGQKIAFGSHRPKQKGGAPTERINVWIVERTSPTEWGVPYNAGDFINVPRGGNYPCITNNGSLYYFTQKTDGIGNCDLYKSRLINGRYTKPTILDRTINTEHHEWDQYVAPDESYIIFGSQGRLDAMSREGDLYISFRKSDGSWIPAVNMGEGINSRSNEICPVVTLDGKYIFFTSRRGGTNDLYWVDAGIIDSYKKN
jgi:Tol biopolymer transport system component